MMRFHELKPGQQFKFVDQSKLQGVYTACQGSKPSDTYYVSAGWVVREANPHEFVRTKVMKEVWE